MSAVVAIDVGDRKIGLAIGDSANGFAFVRPALLVSDWAEAWPLLVTLVSVEQVKKIIVGVPFNADGTAGPQVDRVRQFIAELARHVTVPILERNEHNTSRAVQREQVAHERDLKRGEEDSLAAQLLLESYLQEARP